MIRDREQLPFAKAMLLELGLTGQQSNPATTPAYRKTNRPISFALRLFEPSNYKSNYN
jgi:hypothetical protein